MSIPKQKPGKSKQDYATPRVFITASLAYLYEGGFLFDFAADASNAKAPSWWAEANNSPAHPASEWTEKVTGGWGWLNPPYKNIGPWAKRCLEVSQLGGRIAFLVPASVGANWYRDYIHGQPGVTVLFLNGRIPFMPDKPTWLYPKDCMLVLFGLGGTFHVDVWNWRA